MNLNQLIGANIKSRRIALGMKAETLAREIGVSKATLSLIENGKSSVPVDRLNSIAEKLAVPLTNLFPNARTSEVNDIRQVAYVADRMCQAFSQVSNELKGIMEEMKINTRLEGN